MSDEQVDTPELSELDKLKIETLELKLHNISMQITLLQQDQDKLQTDAKPFIQGLQRPGFQLVKTPQGVLEYQPAKPQLVEKDEAPV